MSVGAAPGSLRDLVAPGAVVVPLRARELPAAVERLRAAAGSAGPGPGAPAVEDLVPIGEHALLARLRDDAVADVRLALGIAPGPLPFAPGTAPGARLLLLLVAPTAPTGRYLQALSALGHMLRRGETAERLAAARSAEEALALPGWTETRLGEELLVRDVMTPGVASVTPEATLQEVAALMASRRLRAVPVVNEAGEILGMITDREVLQHFLPRVAGVSEDEAEDEAGDGGSVPVRDRMLRSVMCVRDDQSLREVANTMVQKDVDRFPVVVEGELAGFLTRGDIIRRLLAPSGSLDGAGGDSAPPPDPRGGMATEGGE